MNKSPAERSIEALTWAAVVIWLGFMLVASLLDQTWLILMVLGIILLSSAIYQRSRQWETSLSIWIFGLWMAVFSVIETVNELIKYMNDGNGLDITLGVYLGIALVSMGVAAILRTMQGPRSSPARRPSDYQTGDYSGTIRPHVVTDNFGAGHYSEPGARAQQTASRYQTEATWNRPPQQTGAYDERAAYEDRRGYDYPGEREGTGYRDRHGPPQPTRGPQPRPGYERHDQQYDQYDGPTEYARHDERPYQEPPPQQAPGGYRYDQPGYAPGQGQQYDPYQYEQYDEYYDDEYHDDENAWDAPPQVQQAPPPPERRRRRQPPPKDRERDDLDARVEDIIRRSRERRNQSVDDMDLPY